MQRLHTILAALAIASAANAQLGQPYIHDPSTLAECDGKYYTFGTGGGGIISDDGWSWQIHRCHKQYLCLDWSLQGCLEGVRLNQPLP